MDIPRPAFRRWSVRLGTLVGVALCVSAQSATSANRHAPPQSPPEISSRDDVPTFTSRVNLVPVSVVVRDSSGRAVGNLTKDDFHLTDQGKPQVIERFSVERSNTPVVVEKAAAPAPEAPNAPVRPESVIPTRFVAYLFDDLHLEFEDIVYAREAASRHVATFLRPTDRIAVYTTSGRDVLEFTADPAALQTALARLRPNALIGGSGFKCPDISYYMADLIVNQNDGLALQVATTQYQACSGDREARPRQVQALAQSALAAGSQETRMTTRLLRDAVRRLSTMPGQRIIVLTSPGFYTELFDHSDIAETISKAISAHVIVNCLDARGVWTPPGYEAASRTPEGGSRVVTMINAYKQFEATSQGQVLREVAEGTGGIWIHDNNDIAGSFQRLATPPEFYYVLGFSPASLKADGKFHNLKVSLRNSRGLTLQARMGYYAPRPDANPAEQARQQLEDAVFTRDVVKDLPVELSTEVSTPPGGNARLAASVRVDLRGLRFRKEGDRHLDNLMVVAALFDDNGNYVADMQKTVELRLKDETLADLTGPPGHGVTVRTSFNVKPGTYVVRVVVRDSESHLMTSKNAVVEVPSVRVDGERRSMRE